MREIDLLLLEIKAAEEALSASWLKAAENEKALSAARLKLANFIIAKTTSDRRTLIHLCPECGSGDVGWCSISVRPYCNECGTWAPVNFGSADESISAWNERVRMSGFVDG